MLGEGKLQNYRAKCSRNARNDLRFKTKGRTGWLPWLRQQPEIQRKYRKCMFSWWKSRSFHRVLSRQEGKRQSSGVMGRKSIEERKTPESKEFNTVEQDGVMRNESVSPESAVFTEGQVGGVHLNMLVDTGSAMTLVHKRVWGKDAPRYGPLETQGTQVVSANGSTLKIVDMADIEIAVAGICVIYPVLIAEGIIHDCLLGFDFLRKHECIIQFGTNHLRTEAEEWAQHFF